MTWLSAYPRGAILLLPERPLPVPVELLNDESGASFCLRLAARNGLSMVELRRLLGLSAINSIKREHVRRLALLSNLRPERLSERFPDELRRTRDGLTFWGHFLRLSSYVRWRRPQICPLCVQQRQMCPGEWDLTFSCVCLEHRCALLDHCPTCNGPLRWDRPAIEWCGGQHFLGKAPQELEPVAPELYEMQAVIRSLLRRTELPEMSFDWPFSHHPVSLNGWFSLISAFGSMSKPYCQPAPGTLNTIPLSAAVRSISVRAYQRLRSFSLRSVDRDESLQSLIADAPLLRLIRESSHEGDRAAAMAVYAFVAGEHALESLVSRNRLSIQLSLFG